jgi:hypothetical protein
VFYQCPLEHHDEVPKSHNLGNAIVQGKDSKVSAPLKYGECKVFAQPPLRQFAERKNPEAQSPSRAQERKARHHVAGSSV